MEKMKAIGLAALAACVLTACGGNGSGGATTDTSGTRGSLIQNPPLRNASLTKDDLTATLLAANGGAQLIQIAGTPACGIDVYYIQYGTVGGKQEPTTASGVLMIPTGTTAQCSGPRPLMLYAHGTAFEHSYNLAAVNDASNPARTESLLVGAIFAAQGYIVVAPNYAGYDSSSLGYHPYLNADQQSKDMIDALTAARKAIGQVFASGTTENGKLFVSGYSQGGHVAMATVRALQQAGTTVTASAPLSGPYALEALTDAIMFGQVDLGSTLFMPLLTASYQQAYGNIYNATTDVYALPYATGIDTLLPSAVPYTTLFPQKLPQTALFSSTTPATGNGQLDAALAVPNDPLFSLGFGNPFLVLNSVRVAYALDALASPDGALPNPQPGVPTAASPQYPLRVAFKTNDLRTAWAPTRPMLLCGGHADPTVYFSVNTGTMQAFWSALPPGLVTVLDVDSQPTGVNDPFAAAKVGFATALAATFAAGGQPAVVQSYHGSLVPPFCLAATRGFFSQF
jgi:acetyl esterase/lipase